METSITQSDLMELIERDIKIKGISNRRLLDNYDNLSLNLTTFENCIISIDGKPAPIIFSKKNCWMKIPFNRFPGSTELPRVTSHEFYWYIFSIDKNHYYICNYKEMRIWATEFYNTSATDINEHYEWLFQIEIVDTLKGYFRWNGESRDERKQSRFLELNNVNKSMFFHHMLDRTYFKRKNYPSNKEFIDYIIEELNFKDVLSFIEKVISEIKLVITSNYISLGVGSPYYLYLCDLLSLIKQTHKVDIEDFIVNNWHNYNQKEKDLILGNLTNNQIARKLKKYNKRKIDQAFNKNKSLNKLLELEDKDELINKKDVLIHEIKRLNNRFGGLPTWKDFGITLDNLFLTNLIKNLVVLENECLIAKNEKESPVVGLFSIFNISTEDLIHSNISEELNILLEWILCNSRNKFLPFGTINHDAKTIEEYKEREIKYQKKMSYLNRWENDVNSKINQLKNSCYELDKKVIEIEKERSVILERINDQKKKSQRIRELIIFSKLNPVAQINHILKSDNNIFYYPDILVDIDEETVMKLSNEKQIKLYDKVKQAHKGKFKPIKIKLKKLVKGL